jgi:hypothetical protein
LSLVSQLTEVYLTKEYWHENKLSKEEADKYHERLLSNGNIITVQDGDILLGYGEFWRITFEQFGRLICHEPFSAFIEDVVSGHICYLANVWVHEDYRTKGVLKQMRNRFFEVNKDCTHFCGEALRKKTQPVKVFKLSNIHLKGDNHG